MLASNKTKIKRRKEKTVKKIIEMGQDRNNFHNSGSINIMVSGETVQGEDGRPLPRKEIEND